MGLEQWEWESESFGWQLYDIWWEDIISEAGEEWEKQTKAKVADANQMLDKECGDDGIVRILVGNKSDLGRDRQLSKEQGVQLQARYKMNRYIDASAK